MNGVDPSGHVGVSTLFKLAYRAVKRIPTLTTKSPGVEKFPGLLTSRGGKEVTALLKIRPKDANRLTATVESYPKRIAFARKNYEPQRAEFLIGKQTQAQEALNFVSINIGSRGMTAHSRAVIKNDFLNAQKALEKIPTVQKIRHSDPVHVRSKLDWLVGKPGDRFTFNPDQ